MKKIILAALVLCCVAGGAHAAELPAFAQDADRLTVAGAIVTDPVLLAEKALNDVDTNLDDTCDRIAASDGMNLGIGKAISSYANGQEGRQCIVFRFRAENETGFNFVLQAKGSGAITLNMTVPDFPAVGVSAQPGKYIHIAQDTFTFEQGEWYCVLFAVDRDAELRIAVWQEYRPRNMAWYHANLAQDAWYEDGQDYCSRDWSLQMTTHRDDILEMDVSGFLIVGFSGFAD